VQRLPPLNSLRAFQAAARCGSFTAAANELHVTQSAVSQQIRLLEDGLNVSLFRRTPRGVSLTKVGEQYLASVESIFSELVAATDRIRKSKAEPLRICSLPTFATRWLVPRLPLLEQACPGLEYNLTVSLQRVDFVGDTVDLAIVHGRPPWPRLVSREILVQDLKPVCSPALLEGPPAIRRPEDLCHHTLLHVAREVDEWQEWLEAAGVDCIDPKRSLRFDSTKMALDAALNGLGVAMGREPFIMDDLKSGALVAPFSLQLRSKSAYYLVYPEEMRERAEIRQFQDWILSEMAAYARN